MVRPQKYRALTPLRIMLASAAFLSTTFIPASGYTQDSSASAPMAAERMNAPDHETEVLRKDAGTWDVVMTFQPAADAKASVIKGIVAERRMVGRYLQETMRPAENSGAPDFRRIAYLTYSGVEGRWQYVSLDTRFPVGIMPAFSFDKGTDDKVTFEFAPLGFVGMGPKVEGRMMRSNFVITRDGDDHELMQQYWVTSDGSGREWLAVQYDCKRRH